MQGKVSTIHRVLLIFPDKSPYIFLDFIDLLVTGSNTIFLMKSSALESENDWNIGVWDYNVPTIGSNADISIQVHQTLPIQTQMSTVNLTKVENREQDEILTIMMNGW